MHIGRLGSLSTISEKQPGYPFGSMMPYGLDSQGRPSFLISTMAMHTRNLIADPRASLLVTDPNLSENPLCSARVTLIGNVLQVREDDLQEVREGYLARNEHARYWVDFKDFHFYRMDVIDIYYVGGFGVMGWVTALEYQSARPDPLADSAAEIIRHMNEDHSDALLLLARTISGEPAGEATLTAVDRLGFHLRLRDGDRVHGKRINFPLEVRTAEQARIAFIQMIQEARATIK